MAGAFSQGGDRGGLRNRLAMVPETGIEPAHLCASSFRPPAYQFWGTPKLICVGDGARDRNRTGTPVIHEAADFKSDVSTYSTTRAHPCIVEQKQLASTLAGIF